LRGFLHDWSRAGASEKVQVFDKEFDPAALFLSQPTGKA
jgi:hypothetical protein